MCGTSVGAFYNKSGEINMMRKRTRHTKNYSGNATRLVPAYVLFNNAHMKLKR